MPPEISVIIPVYNGAAYLAEAIESIFAQNVPVQLIVLDDGSTDGTRAVAEAYGDRLRYHYQPNRGLGAARNAGLALACGEFMAFLDADDIWLPHKLARQMEVLRENAGIAMVFGMVELFHSPELSEERKQQLPDHGKILAGVSGGTMLARKTAMQRAGAFSAEVQIGEFVDWFARAMEAGLKSFMLKEVVMMRRLHNSNMGVTMKNRRHEYLKVLKDSLDRRRKRA